MKDLLNTMVQDVKEQNQPNKAKVNGKPTANDAERTKSELSLLWDSLEKEIETQFSALQEKSLFYVLERYYKYQADRNEKFNYHEAHNNISKLLETCGNGSIVISTTGKDEIKDGKAFASANGKTFVKSSVKNANSHDVIRAAKGVLSYFYSLNKDADYTKKMRTKYNEYLEDYELQVNIVKGQRETLLNTLLSNGIDKKTAKSIVLTTFAEPIKKTFEEFCNE